MGTYKVNVMDEDMVVARVQYNTCLDFWDGRNWSCGSTARHKGLTRLRNGDYVLIRGTDWQGEKDYAYVISEKEALNEILKSNNMDLLKLKKYKELNELYLSEYEDAEITDDDLDF